MVSLRTFVERLRMTFPFLREPRFGTTDTGRSDDERVQLLPNQRVARSRGPRLRHVIDVGARISSTRPQSRAVGAWIALPSSPERRGPLPSDTAGEARRASGAGDQAERYLRKRDAVRQESAMTRPANAAISIPPPNVEPWMRISTRSRSRSISAAGLRASRVT